MSTVPARADRLEPDRGVRRDTGDAADRSGIEEGPLATLWARHRGTNAQRVAVLEAAAAAVLEQGLAPALREQALGEAHKLAGSLGSFGFPDGTRLAREAESLLSARPIDARRLAETVVGLRSLVERPSTPPSRGPRRSDRAATTARPRLLLVSRDEDLVTRLTLAAVGAGVDLEAVPDIESTVLLPAETTADVVLVDLATAPEWMLGDDVLSGPERELAAAPVIALARSPTFADRLQVSSRGWRMLMDRETSPSEVVATARRALRRPERERRIVHVVDDDPVVRDTLLVLLEGHDLHVVGLASATEGWEALEREPPDLLVVDLDLPGVGGLDLCRAVRTDPRWQRLPMLVLTARDDPSAVVEAFEAGADDYVPKPVVGPELEARIFSHLERSHLHRELADTDPLTGLQNRRQSELTITRLLRLAGRRGETLAFAILDLDRFKGLNDRWGHLAGDAVLRRVGALLTSSLRGEDVVARWGGEEFAIGLTGMTASAAAKRLESLLGELKAERFDEAGAELVVSFSAGVAEFPRDGETLERLYSAADQALFRAKASRSCILTADG